jgi:membrane-associated phospholipid phosphatase
MLRRVVAELNVDDVELPPSDTRDWRATRPWAMAGYAVLLTLWCWLVGIPKDPGGVFLWLWLGVAAWSPARARDFGRDWWPVLAGLAIYWFSRGFADNLGIPVHYAMPVGVDHWLDRLLGGSGHQVPTEWLQDVWCGDPCSPASPPRWYDAVFTTVYSTHFVAGLAIAAILWVRKRAEWVLFMRRYVVLNFAALVVYVFYPMAPPWMAARDGVLAHGSVHRLTSRGWDDLGLSRVPLVLFGLSNKVAAMPSLHAAVATFIAAYGIWRLRSTWRWLLVLYPVAMSTALVYDGEHYLVDVLAGFALTALVMVGCAGWELWRSRVPDAWEQIPLAAELPPGQRARITAEP